MAVAKKFDPKSNQSIDAFIRRTNAQLEQMAKHFGVQSEYYKQYESRLAAYGLTSPNGKVGAGINLKKITDVDGTQVQIIQLKRSKTYIEQIKKYSNRLKNAERNISNLPKYQKVINEGVKKKKNVLANKGKTRTELEKEVRNEIKLRQQLDLMIKNLLNELYKYQSDELDTLLDDLRKKPPMYQSTDEKQKIVDKLNEILKIEESFVDDSGTIGSDNDLDDFITLLDIDEY